jgi:hypothetical protein
VFDVLRGVVKLHYWTSVDGRLVWGMGYLEEVGEDARMLCENAAVDLELLVPSLKDDVPIVEPDLFRTLQWGNRRSFWLL